MAAAKGCEVSLPSNSIGYLIGKLGVTVQELQKLTDCRISIPRRKDGSENELTSIRIRCLVARSPDEMEMREAKCVRVAQLLCLENLSLPEAVAQADREQKTQEMVEIARLKQQEERMAMQRILINWPDFEKEDVIAALHEACHDEDRAIDLLLAGFGAPQPLPVFEVPRPCASQKHHSKKVQAEKEREKEEYPSLIPSTLLDVNHNSNIRGSTRGMWSPNGITLGADTAPENTTNNFPNLPAAGSLRPVCAMRNPCKIGPRRNLCVTSHIRRVKN